MKLFLFTNFFPYKRSEPFLVTEFEFAKRHFKEISVFTLYGNPSDSSITDNENVKLFTPVFDSAGNKKSILLKGLFNLSPCHFHFKELFSKKIIFSGKRMYWFFISLLITRTVLSSRAYKDLIKGINANPGAVLYFYWGDNLTWILPYLKEKINAKIKIIVRLHGSDLYEHLKGDYSPLRKNVFSCADKIFTVAENGRSYLAKKYPEFENKIFVSRLGVKDNGLNPKSQDGIIKLVSVSNVVPVKRVKLIFEALQQNTIKIEWHHFGDGSLFEELKNLAANKRKDLNIHLHGYVTNNQLMEYYKTNHVDVFINVSYSEGLPVSIMEALSFGIPVIATDVGGTAELVNDEVGKLIERDFAAKKLAKLIDEFFKQDLSKVEMMRKNARLRFEKLVNAEKNYGEFYENLIG